jgi:hypothetical protein
MVIVYGFRRRLWFISKFYSGTSLERQGTPEHLTDNWESKRDYNRAISECKSRWLPIHQLVWCKDIMLLHKLDSGNWTAQRSITLLADHPRLTIFHFIALPVACLTMLSVTQIRLDGKRSE